MHNFFFLHSSVKKDFCIENWIVNQIRIFLLFNNINKNAYFSNMIVDAANSGNNLMYVHENSIFFFFFFFFSSFSFRNFFLYRSKHEIERIGVITDGTRWWSSIVNVWREIYREKNKKIIDVNVKRERENFFAVVIVSISMRI